jgi:hypothetical protein
VDEARDLTERIRRAPDAAPGLVLHAFITRAWIALDYGDWGAYCRDVTPFRRVRRGPGSLLPRPRPRLTVVQTVTGTFELSMSAQPPMHDADGVTITTITVDKRFAGPLRADGRVHMISATTPITDSAGYVAIERITGSLDGRSGSFLVVHTGLLDRGQPTLAVSIVPDSGTGELTGIRGRMTIDAAEGTHVYALTYEIRPDLRLPEDTPDRREPTDGA